MRALRALHYLIEAAWRPGQFPGWWSRLDFAILDQRYQHIWHHCVHAPPDIAFKRYKAHHE